MPVFTALLSFGLLQDAVLSVQMLGDNQCSVFGFGMDESPHSPAVYSDKSLVVMNVARRGFV
jgi:hypothetical protein